jgi:hypothetical protein
MSMAAARHRELQHKFRGMVRSRLTPARRHDIAVAASLQQIAEVVVAEMVLGTPHDRSLVARLQAEVRARLASAGVKTK